MRHCLHLSVLKPCRSPLERSPSQRPSPDPGLLCFSSSCPHVDQNCTHHRHVLGMVRHGRRQRLGARHLRQCGCHAACVASRKWMGGSSVSISGHSGRIDRCCWYVWSEVLLRVSKLPVRERVQKQANDRQLVRIDDGEPTWHLSLTSAGDQAGKTLYVVGYCQHGVLHRR